MVILFSFVHVSLQSRSVDLTESIPSGLHKNFSLKIAVKHKFPTPREKISKKDYISSPVLYQSYSYEYYSEIDIGTPSQTMMLNIDTGHSDSWVRCHDCDLVSCSQPTYFNHHNSASYNKLPCGKCSWPARCRTSECTLQSRYSNGNFAHSVLALETFTLQIQNGGGDDDEPREKKFQNVPVGCSYADVGFHDIDGSLALSRGKRSFYTFLKENYSVNKFSYCLIDRRVGLDGVSADLIFGESEVSRDIFYTPMIDDYYHPGQDYGVVVTGIEVQGQKLAETSFPIKMVIDSGATTTDLPDPIYIALEKLFLGYANAMGWGSPYRILGRRPCYKVIEDDIADSPTVTFTFNGSDAKMLLLPYSIWSYVPDVKAVCFGFGSASKNGGVNIIGNIFQQHTRIVIDQTMGNHRIGFDPSSC